MSFLFFFFTLIVAVFFFFSSRRRHTRLTCDWSSDVCSSDLASICHIHEQRSSPKKRENVGECDQRFLSSVNCPRQPKRAEDSYQIDKDITHVRSEEHTSELQSHVNLVCRLLLEKKKKKKKIH